MSQHDFEIANQGFPAFRSDLNSGLQALASNSAGATEPSTTYAYQFWYDETTDLLKMRNGDDDAWITLAFFDQTNDEWEVRSAVIQAVDSAGVSIKTDDGTTRIEIQDDGDVSIDSGTLFVDATNNEVGIGTTSPESNLHVLKSGSVRVKITSTSNDPAGAGIFLTTENGGSVVSEATVRTNNAGRLSFFTGTTSGTSEVGFFDASANLAFNSGYGSVATAYGCRAWVNFKGTGLVEIREDGNVSSITDKGAGNYNVNFTNAMPDANYAAAVTLQRENTSANFANVYGSFSNDTWATTGFEIRSMFINDASSGYTDTLRASVAVFR